MTQAPAAPQTPAPQKLWNRNFLLWWLGAAQSALGSALSGIALSFLVLHQTGSVGAMGVNLALSMLPALFAPFFGTLIDRLPLKPPLIACHLLRGVMQLGIGFAALRGPVPIEAIYAVSFLTGLIAAFYTSASMGVTVRLVPQGQLQRATGLMQGTSQTMQTAGLLGGGFLVALLGRGEALIFDGVTFLVFAALLLPVQFPPRKAAAAGERFWQSFRGGLKYARGSVLLTGLPLVALVLNASFAPLDMLIPGRMQLLGAGAAGYGLFFGMLVAGMAAGGFLVAWLGERVKPARASVWGMALMGTLTLLLAFTQTAPQMYALALLMGLANAFCNMGIGVIFQTRVDPDFYGRVGSLLNAVGMVGMPVTLLALSPFADRIPVAVIFGVAGGMTLLGAAVWGAILRRDGASTAPAAAPA